MRPGPRRCASWPPSRWGRAVHALASVTCCCGWRRRTRARASAAPSSWSTSSRRCGAPAATTVSATPSSMPWPASPTRPTPGWCWSSVVTTSPDWRTTPVSALARDATLLVGAPTRAEVRRMVEVPARGAGLVLDPGLPRRSRTTRARNRGCSRCSPPRCLQDAGNAGARDRLTYADYVAWAGSGCGRPPGGGGVRGLAERDRAAARVSCCGWPGGPAPATWSAAACRSASSTDCPATSASGRRARGRATADGAGDAVEVAHESLCSGSGRGSPRWLADDVSTRTVQHRLAVAASSGRSRAATRAVLARCGLQSALDVMAAYPDETTAVEHEFLVQCRGGARRGAARGRAAGGAARTPEPGLRVLLSAAVVLLLVAVAAGVLAAVHGGRPPRPATVSRRQPSPPTRDAWRRRRSTRSSSTWPCCRRSRPSAPSPAPRRTAPCSACWRAPPTCCTSGAPRRPSCAPPPATTAHSRGRGVRPPGRRARRSAPARRWSRDVPGGGHVLAIDGDRAGFLVTSGTTPEVGGPLWDDGSGRTRWSLVPDDLAPLIGEGDTRICWTRRGWPTAVSWS